jgi:ElaB/YqjD/DUF883 family membrane-anchored ribosome-binding protein
VTISKGERVELRSLIKQRFKVLRGEVDARAVELDSELRERVKQRFAEFDKQWDDATYLIDEAAREANRKANDIIRSVYPDAPTDRDYKVIEARHVGRPDTGKHQMLADGSKRINAQVTAARQQLARQEVDLLTRLAVEALESDEARAFLGEIPSVSALVPADRLLELEQSLRSEDGPS